MSSAYEKGGSRSNERLALQQEFLDFVGTLRSADVATSPDLSSGINHKGTMIQSYDVDISSGQNALLIEQTHLDELLAKGNGHLPHRIDFSFKPALEIGKADSRRKVSFGAAKLSWFDRQGMELTVPLAVKPFDLPQSERTFMHEVAMMKYCAEQGVRVPNYFGMALYNEGRRGAMLSVVEPDLITLDNINWASLDENEVQSYLSIAIETLATLHERALFHGDSEFKNIAFQQQEEGVTIVDLEFMASLRQLEAPQVTRWAQLMSNDFRSLRTSMERSGLLVGSETDKYERFFRLVLLPYIHMVQHSKSEYISVISEAHGRVVDAFAAEACGDDFSRILQGLGSFAMQ